MLKMNANKPTKCHCGCTKIRKQEGFRVFIKDEEIKTYWSSKGRNEVIKYVREQHKESEIEFIANEPHTHIFECTENYHLIKRVG
jgi:hypothetical protein